MTDDERLLAGVSVLLTAARRVMTEDAAAEVAESAHVEGRAA